jgi:hypothetical protein
MYVISVQPGGGTVWLLVSLSQLVAAYPAFLMLQNKLLDSSLISEASKEQPEAILSATLLRIRPSTFSTSR